MKPSLIILIVLSILSCKEEAMKKYEDYNEEDFIEVQGLVINVQKEFAFQYRKVDVTYIYDLQNEKPNIGYEADTPFIPIAGSPAIILVHKFKDGVTFLGGLGYIEDENDIIKEYIEKSEQFGVEYYGVDQSLLEHSEN